MRINFTTLNSNVPGTLHGEFVVTEIKPGEETKIAGLFALVQAQTSNGKFSFWSGLEDLAMFEAAD